MNAAQFHSTLPILTVLCGWRLTTGKRFGRVRSRMRGRFGMDRPSSGSVGCPPRHLMPRGGDISRRIFPHIGFLCIGPSYISLCA